ncbi:NACHT domain-containing protein [Clavibacter michiganensis]|uniref:NACHT domain-containing protein n=1 Tax=Clavibacter michiganensis TaxID=28447 RepID=UPI00292F867C|nr:NACHT domain-containing protein [Clavibacter michiganensis]
MALKVALQHLLIAKFEGYCTQYACHAASRVLTLGYGSIVIETLGYAVAASAAKAIFSFWTTGVANSDSASDVTSLVVSTLTDSRDRRAAERQISGMAESIYNQLEPQIAVEYGRVDAGEVEIVLEAVQSVVGTAAASAELVIKSDFDSMVLERHIRHEDSALRSFGLSERGQAFYDMMITECCDYITEIAAQLPDFQTQAAREILRRETSLMTLAQDALLVLPKSSVPDTFGRGTDHERFETRYKRAVAAFANKLELFGVTSDTARRPYDLSVAYISLGIMSQAPGSAPEGRDRPDEDDGVTSRADAYFADHSKVLLTGDAGSGKTTLLRWLAGLAARNASAVEEAGSWRDRVPFVIPLRQFADEALPTPGMYINLIKPNLAETAPPGWAHHVLEAGRGAVLVDGLDEVPIARRGEVLAWIDELNQDFPGNSILVTSRGAALTSEWESSTMFDRASLQAMSPSYIQSFVNHWHDAMRRTVLADERDHVSVAHAGMLNVIKTRANIRALSRTPLLCALMCALHLENASSLPNDKMSLYRTALEMLVMKRDNDRRLARTDKQLSLTDRMIVLQRLAMWMHENGVADAPYAAYQAAIGRSLLVLNKANWTEEEAASFMLERCGVLRQPMPERVDFIHRSFLEYLAAAAEVSDDSIPKLLMHATEETWREVVIMAAGHANNAQRRRILEGLLDRGSAEDSNRHQLYLLAVACLQTVPELPVDLRDRLQDALNSVVPPTTMTEASAVASAGQSAAPLLKRSNMKVMEAVCSVRALALIGGQEAFESLKTYRREHRLTVIRQLLRAWPAFDAEEYANEVLVDSPFIRGEFRVTEPEQVVHLSKFRRLETIHIDISERLAGWDDLASVSGDERVASLELTSMTWMLDLSSAPILPGLRFLRLKGVDFLQSLIGIERYSELEHLEVTGAISLRDLGRLNLLPKLQTLVIDAPSLETLSVLSMMERPIESARVRCSANLRSIGPRIVAKEFALSGYYVGRGQDSAIELSGLAGSSDMKKLSLELFAYPPSVELPAGLTRLIIGSSVNQLSGGEAVETLITYEAPSAGLMRWIQDTQSLLNVQIVSVFEVADIHNILAAMPRRSGFNVTFPAIFDFDFNADNDGVFDGYDVEVEFFDVTFVQHE